MEKFWCFGKNEICDDHSECFGCSYFDGNGGQGIEIDDNDFIGYLLAKGYHIVSKGEHEYAILPPEGI